MYVCVCRLCYEVCASATTISGWCAAVAAAVKARWWCRRFAERVAGHLVLTYKGQHVRPGHGHVQLDLTHLTHLAA